MTVSSLTYISISSRLVRPLYVINYLIDGVGWLLTLFASVVSTSLTGVKSASLLARFAAGCKVDDKASGPCLYTPSALCILEVKVSHSHCILSPRFRGTHEKVQCALEPVPLLYGGLEESLELFYASLGV